jgi:hypothetical protein
MMRKLLACVIVVGISFQASGEESLVITTFDNDGTLTFSGLQAGTTATVQWTSGFPGTNDATWHDLAVIPVTDYYMAAEWPRFFRVEGVLSTNSTGGLTPYYPLDGDTHDATVNGHDGAAVGGPLLTTNRFGEADKAYLFDGFNDHIYVAASPVFDMPSVWTYAAWCRVDAGAPATSLRIAGNGEASSGFSQAFLRFDAAQDRFNHNFESPGGGINLFSAGTYPDRDRWHHVVGTRRAAGEAVLYVDGIESDRASGTNPAGSSQGPVVIGAEYNSATTPGGFFKGAIDEVRIYGRALCSNEVWNLFNLNL